MWGINFDRFSSGRPDVQEQPLICDTCSTELSGLTFFNDVCDQCAVNEGSLETEEYA